MMNIPALERQAKANALLEIAEVWRGDSQCWVTGDLSPGSDGPKPELGMQRLNGRGLRQPGYVHRVYRCSGALLYDEQFGVHVLVDRTYGDGIEVREIVRDPSVSLQAAIRTMLDPAVEAVMAERRAKLSGDALASWNRDMKRQLKAESKQRAAKSRRKKPEDRLGTKEVAGT